ncbi:MAG: hypothetical protein NXH88_09235 [Hyphomonas sp.]|nr:hypothetical protein [Hyphomonas sp.]
MAFWALAGASALSGLAQYVAGNEAADANKDAARENNQLQRYMFDRTTELSEPWRVAGIGALNEQQALLGLAPTSAYAGSGGSPGGNDFSTYVGNYGDLQNAFNGLTPANMSHIARAGFDANQDGVIDQGEFGQFHYQTNGQREGRNMPTFAVPTAEETTATQGDAYQRFLDGGFARSMLETTNADMDNMIGAFGAGGTAMSGATLGALNDRNRRNTNNAFTQHWNALGGMSGSGGNVAMTQGNQGQQFANAFSANNNNAANAQGSSYMNMANAFGNTLQNGANAYMYGKENGWFG